MKHTTIDQYARSSSFYRIDPRAKIIGFLLFVVCVALMQSLFFLVLALFVIFLFGVASAVPTKHLVTRYLIALPFILFPSLAALLGSGNEMAISMFVRISSSVLALIILSATTDFMDLLKGFQWMRMPQVFLILLLFMYRFIFLLTDEMHKMSQARKARGFRGGKHILDRLGMRTISFTAGSVLVRASERGNRVYDAMLTRGFNGKVRTLNPMKFRALAWVFVLLLSVISLILLLSDWEVMLWVI